MVGEAGATVIVERVALQVNVDAGEVNPSFVAVILLVPPPLEVQSSSLVAVNGPTVAMVVLLLEKIAEAVTGWVEPSE